MNFDFSKYFNAGNFERLMWVLLILIVGITIIYLVAFIAKKLLRISFSLKLKLIILLLISYSGYILLVFILTAPVAIVPRTFFGAAGVIGLVVCLASQTSIGNIVSGFFLVGEKSFEIGDVIQVGDKAGVVFFTVYAGTTGLI